MMLVLIARASAATPAPADQADAAPSQPATSRTSLAQATEPERSDTGLPISAEGVATKDPATNDLQEGDDYVSITVSAAPARPPAREGESVSFDLRLSQAMERLLMIVYATPDGTAKHGTDYEAQRGVLTFEPGETTAEVQATLFEDDAAEGEEQFGLFLSVDPNLAKLSERQITTIILDDD